MKRHLILISVLILLLSTALLLILLKKTVQSPPTKSNNPIRIVSLAPNVTEILYKLGLGEKIVAVSSDSDYPPQARSKTNVGTFWQPDTEAIIAARADLTVTLSFEQQKNIADRLEQMGYSTLTVKIETLNDLYSAIEKLGKATGKPMISKQLSNEIRQKIEAIKSKYANTKKQKVLWVIQPQPLRVAGRDTFINEIIEITNGINAVGPTVQQYPPISTEELIAADPDVIIQSGMGGDLDNERQIALEFWSKFPSLSAVKNSKIYVIQSDSVLRLGPRIIEGIDDAARCLHGHQ